MSDLLDTLERLLEAERRAIAAGDLSQLGNCAERKAGCLAQLAEVPPDVAARLAALARALERNQILHRAALEGVRAATERLAAIRAAQHSLTTYDAQGRAAELPAPRSGLMRKA